MMSVPYIQHIKESDTLMIKGDLVTLTVMDVLSGMKLYNTLNQWVVNLSGVEKVDSSAIAFLLELMKRAKELNITISFSHIPKELMAIAHLSQLDSFFTPRQ